MRTVVHLIRHAEVENPLNVWYGRLEGFHISERGHRQAAALAEHFEDADLAAIYASPLTRAIETASYIAEAQSLEVIEEPDIIESETLLEGRHGDLRLFRNPLMLRYFLNPFRPSWGEPYKALRARMRAAVERMIKQHEGAELAAVSHMTPILIARLEMSGDRRPPWRAGYPCGRASVTTLRFEGMDFESLDYLEVGADID